MRTVALISMFCILPVGIVSAASDPEMITINHKMEIPGKTLKAGRYTFEVEDRLQDRAIIRITDSKRDTHELLLAVPNEKLNQPELGRLIFFSAAHSKKQILHGWMCPSCQVALEVVYPKAEAVKITGVSAKPVLAVDPTYDKLPKNLSPDDMKVVTLWLLSPKEVTPNQKGKGLEAAKWADTTNKTEVASAAPATARGSMPEASQLRSESPVAQSSAQSTTPVPVRTVASSSGAAESSSAPVVTPSSSPVATPSQAPATPVESAELRQPTHPRRMPHTASNTFNFGLIGLGLLISRLVLRLLRRDGGTKMEATR